MLLEMHCHTAEHSACSRVSAVELVRKVHVKRLQGVVLTDHHYLWQEADLAELRRQAGVPPDFVILSGQETNVPVFGDVLIYGAPVTIPRGTPLTVVRQEFPDLVVVWAHPYRNGREPTDELLRSPLLNGVEIFNSNHTVQENSQGLQDWRRLQLVATSGTDTHAASYAATYPTVFDQPIRTIRELVQAVRSGQCRPYLKEVSHREASKVIEVTIGNEKPDRTQEKIIVRTPPNDTAWSAAERAYHIMTAISERGFDQGMFRVPQPIQKNADSGTILEQGLTGESLFDRLVAASTDEAQKYLRLCAQWLARLHLQRLRITSPEEFLREETRRLTVDLNRFTDSDPPYRNKITGIVRAVQAAEQDLMVRDQESWIQGHGDYQSQNIIIGRDGAGGEAGFYLGAIDFERSQVMPPAFDVGWFLAQARSQFDNYPALSGGLVEETFLDAYVKGAAAMVTDDFWRQVELFRARANVSIAGFLVKMGMAGSPELWRILVESERALTYVG
ncbi:phosphotransferase [Geomesophilobacter sediminis]|uniref:Phosphotransferase n=1 Tax=Geomesophilobacter sediminis TaxID=2798584 RepID=A0A8J7LYJ0_9BACT|nr:phosphotransferase [Geomesophilobacter sediminis]MBJ6725161.1 phosphotransferase [Geomesophilobacter sediminis]